MFHNIERRTKLCLKFLPLLQKLVAISVLKSQFACTLFSALILQTGLVQSSRSRVIVICTPCHKFIFLVAEFLSRWMYLCACMFEFSLSLFVFVCVLLLIICCWDLIPSFLAQLSVFSLRSCSLCLFFLVSLFEFRFLSFSMLICQSLLLRLITFFMNSILSWL